MAASSKLLAGRYQPLGVIGRGATGTVYRALDRLSGRHVALKTLGLEAPHEASARDAAEQPARTAELLAREFRLLAGLRHPNIVVSLDHAFDDAVQSFFTMDLQANACTLREAASRQPLATKVDLLVQLLHALAYLHRRGLVHRDVKPENALCVGGVVKLIDFGLAVTPDETVTQTDAGSCGTLAYAAPELLRGAPFQPSADLYAVGIIAYEIFAGRHPFDTSSPAKLLQSVFRSTPDFTAAGIEPRLVDVLRRLLARAPAERFGSAFEVITALSTALDRTVAAETTSTRNSFLHAAGLIGRESEMERLRVALPTVVNPERRPILVGGESGIGKSRLLDELTVEAKVQGVRVLRGQARREGARPYESWRGVLRLLILLADPHEREAAALESVVPDIATLLGRDVETAPELDPAATHIRLARVVEALLRRCNEPLLIVLEDMQWVGDESLKLFKRVQAIAPELRVLLLATYRSDERPDLLAALPGVDHLALGGLGPNAVERLCASMVGEGSDPARRSVVERVQRESHGNVFLVLELMRVLADEAGGLERIPTATLPEQILSGDIAKLVRRRVERLSPPERAFLRTAAVAGRELDLEVLAAIHVDLDVRASAARGVEAAVLSSAQGRWWFAHDRVRDALVDGLADEERRVLHGRIAHAVVALSPDQASTLAHHFGAAGELEREREFAALAGDQFLSSGAYHDAIPYLRRALALTRPTTDRLTRATLERKLGEALFRCGNLIEGRESLGAALATLGRPLPTTRARVVHRVLDEARVQVGLRARRTPPPAATTAESALFEEAILAYTQLSRLAHHLNDEELVLLVTLSALNLAERGDLRAHHARLAAVMGSVMGLVPVHRWARFYFGLAHELSSQLGDRAIEAFVLAHQGYYEAGIGQWQDCREHLERSMTLYDGIGDVRLWEESVSILAYALFYQGELPRSLELYRALERSGEERVDVQIIGWGLTNRLKLLVRSGAIANVDELLERADGLMVDGITKAVRDGVKVELELARRDLVAARTAAGVASTRLERAPPRSFMACSTYAAVAEVHLARWAAGTGGARDEVRRLQQAAERANRALAKIARVFPIAEPARLLHAGTFESLRGRTGRARELWEKAARVAADRELPLEEALALDALARCAGSEDRESKRARATMLFDRLGTSPERRGTGSLP